MAIELLKFGLLAFVTLLVVVIPSALRRSRVTADGNQHSQANEF